MKESCDLQKLSISLAPKAWVHMDSSDSPPPPHTIHQSVSPPSTHGPLCEPQVPNIAPTAAPPAPPENRPDKGARAGGRRVRGRGQMGRAPLRAGGRRRALGPPTLSGGRLRFGAAGSPALANPLARRRGARGACGTAKEWVGDANGGTATLSEVPGTTEAAAAPARCRDL